MTQIVSRIKLLFRKDKELYAKLSKILGFIPGHINYYQIALSHRSQSFKDKAGRKNNNERLEYLGDAILEAVVSDMLYRKYPYRSEGFLTNTRSKLVSRIALNELAEEIGLKSLIHSHASNDSFNNNIGGNAFEALIGAIYLDKGYKKCRDFIQKQIFSKLVDVDDMAKKEVNFKSKLLEYCQKNRIHIEYVSKANENTPNHAPVFRTLAKIEDVVVGEGHGHSKKESEQNASKEALIRMRKKPAIIEQIYQSKEKRTSMEASEFVALPRIDEIEEEIQHAKEEKAQKKAEKKKSRNQNFDNNTELSPDRQQKSDRDGKRFDRGEQKLERDGQNSAMAGQNTMKSEPERQDMTQKDVNVERNANQSAEKENGRRKKKHSHKKSGANWEQMGNAQAQNAENLTDFADGKAQKTEGKAQTAESKEHLAEDSAQAGESKAMATEKPLQKDNSKAVENSEVGKTQAAAEEKEKAPAKEQKKPAKKSQNRGRQRKNVATKSDEIGENSIDASTTASNFRVDFGDVKGKLREVKDLAEEVRPLSGDVRVFSGGNSSLPCG